MISELFIFMHLPGEIEPVVCAKLSQLKVQNPASAIYELVYGNSYLNRKNALPIDPNILPLKKGYVFRSKPDQLFGALEDAMPDYWGKRVIERRLKRNTCSPMDFLYHAGEDRIGALAFSPVTDPSVIPESYQGSHDLDDILEAVERIDLELPLPPEMDDLLKTGSGVGGARPKASIQHKNSCWVAKFNRTTDKIDICKAEFLTLQLAKICGLNVPDIEILERNGRSVFLIKRFDRQWSEQGHLKHHYLSVNSVFQTSKNYMTSHLPSYTLFAHHLTRLSMSPAVDKQELFKRMVFNIMVSNTDDHARNHGLLNKGKGWHLSPLFDVVPHLIPKGDFHLNMEVGDQGTLASIGNALSQSDIFGLDKTTAKETIKMLAENIKGWSSIAKEIGLPTHDIAKLKNSFLNQSIHLIDGLNNSSSSSFHKKQLSLLDI